MLYLKEAGTGDREGEWRFLCSVPENDHGLMNRWHGISQNEYENEVLAVLIRYAKGIGLPEGHVPETYYFLYDGDTIVGLFKIRHCLNEALRNGAGHIGYYIAPSYRGKGFASEGLHLALLEAGKLAAEDEILLRTGNDNRASLRVMLKNHGQIRKQDEENVYVAFPNPGKAVRDDYEIQKLERDTWKGTMLPVDYTSAEFYDMSVNRTGSGFQIPIEKKPFEHVFTHRSEDGEYPDRLYEDWWEGAEAYGIVENGELLGAVELCPEEWSNRLLVTELFVHEKLRGRGYGHRLISLAKDLTVERNYRVLMLETQSSNVNAVDFYLHEGFTLIGFDSCCYTNKDLERKEVRFNMGWFPPAP